MELGTSCWDPTIQLLRIGFPCFYHQDADVRVLGELRHQSLDWAGLGSVHTLLARTQPAVPPEIYQLELRL
jgi:hypothetical protein